MNLPLKILLVEDNPAHCLLFKEFIRIRKEESIEVLNTDTLCSAIDILTSHSIDVIVLDLYLPDSEGLNTFYTIAAVSGAIPVIILSGLKDSKIALAAIKQGAQDYLIKGDYNEKILYKTLYYSIERKKIEEKLRLSNERYALLAKATSEAVWDMNFFNQTIDYWNSGMETLFGYTPETMNNSYEWWLNRIHPEDKHILIEALEVLHEKNDNHFSLEYRFRCANDQYKHVLVRAYVIYHKGEVFRMIGSTQDIHQLKIAQEELAHEQIKRQRLITEKAIEIQERERAQLGRELHDNINQRLASTRICLDAAIRNAENRLEMLKEGVKNLAVAVTEIRKMSHELTPPSLDNIGLNDAVLDIIGPIMVSYPIKIRCKIDTLHVASTIQLMLYRIIQEQLHNIIKYAKASYVLITVKETENVLKLEISDNGIGFDPQAKTDGVGLRNIKSRAQVCDGTAEIISSPGNGCTVRLAIPVKKIKTT